MSVFRTVWDVLLPLVLTGSMLATVYYNVRAVMNRTPAARRNHPWYLDPWRSMGYPHELTEIGKMYRRRCIISVAVLVVFVVLAQVLQGTP